MVATHIPNTTGAVHAPPSAVAPSVASEKIVPDAKGNGVYVAPVPATPATMQISAPLSMLIPASFSTNAATLSASAVYAAQAMAQDPSVYETMLAASEVKYKPSNAAAPEPAPNNLFAKMLAEKQYDSQQTIRNIQQPPTINMPTAQVQTSAPKTPLPAPRKSEATTHHSNSVHNVAVHAYEISSARNNTAPSEVEIVNG